ncbi:hypothetical protein AALO_G00086730 [Alosa alosa]|uniref:Uncharacterized protein n=1 Tax=Alosa alosa TaxID=278164 RepID=A0AAV6GZM9_9TELE|nr:hypothetical protein AALO_G00086730 [Alosa alosa]
MYSDPLFQNIVQICIYFIIFLVVSSLCKRYSFCCWICKRKQQPDTPPDVLFYSISLDVDRNASGREEDSDVVEDRHGAPPSYESIQFDLDWPAPYFVSMCAAGLAQENSPPVEAPPPYHAIVPPPPPPP